MIIDDIKNNLAQIEGQLITPVDQLESVVNASKQNVEETIGAEITELQRQIDELENEKSVKEAQYEEEMASLQGIETSLTYLAALKGALGQV